MRRLGVWIATTGPAGYAPIAPGTVGSAVGVVLYLATSHWSFQYQALLMVGRRGHRRLGSLGGGCTFLPLRSFAGRD